MVNEKCEIWDIVEVEFHIFVWSVCFIASFTGHDSSLHWFRGSRFTDKLRAILFLPFCAAICALGARYGGDFLMRCAEALLKWKPLDLAAEFDAGKSVWEDYPASLSNMGLAYSPIIWALLSETANRFRWWPLAAVFAALLSSLVATTTYIIAAILAVVMLILLYCMLPLVSLRRKRVIKMENGRTNGSDA